MGITNLLGLARDALTAQGFGLDVTGQNIANAGTPGYVKRTAMLETRAVGTVTYGGVTTAGISRSVDRFLDARAYEAGSFSASARSRDGALAQVEGLFNDGNGTGLSGSLQALFSSFSALATNPGDPTARAAALANADGFATRLRETSAQLTAQRADLLTQAQGTAAEVSETASQIAKLNARIAEAEVAGADGSDLKDQRDKLVGALAEKINIHVFTDGAGKLVVSAAGATIVEGNNAAGLAVTASASGEMQILVQRSNGTTFDVTAQTTAGTLGGLREARETDLASVSQKLDRLAYDIGTAINTQHAAGVGLDGTGGRNLFTLTGPTGAAASITLNSVMAGRPEYLAAASSSTELPSGSSNAIALARLSDGNVASGNTRTPIEAYSDLVGDV